MHASCLTGWCISCSSEGAPARERVLKGSILPDVGFLLPGFSLEDRFVLLKAFDCSPTICAIDSITTNRARPTSTTCRPAAAGTRLVRHRDTLPRRTRLVRHRDTLLRQTWRRSRGDDAMHTRHVPTAACYLLCFGRWSGPPPPTRPGGSWRGFRGVVTREVVTHRPDSERRICQIKQQCQY